MSGSRDATVKADIKLDALQIMHNQLSPNTRIGSGTYSVITKCTWNGRTVAVKSFTPKMRTRSAKKEIAIHDFITKANIPYCIKFFGYVETPHSIVMEHASGGTLRDYIANNDIPGWDIRLRMMKELLTAIDNLQKNNLLHRDIKSENLLLDDELHIRVADFGFAKFFKPNKVRTKKTGLKGTPLCMAPEVFAEGSYSFKSDIYSAAIVLWEIASWSKEPYHDGTDFYEFTHSVIVDNLRPRVPSNWPKHIIKAITLGWSAQPKGRPTPAELITILETGTDAIPGNPCKP